VGAASLKSEIEKTAASIRNTLGFTIEERRKNPTWTDALRHFIEQVDALGILVMVNGVVGNNNQRKLDPAEFRGFALSDDLAPLIFINGADTKAAQMFTLAHELAHIWLGRSALDNLHPIPSATHGVERWCNDVAAELLVPLTAFHEEFYKKEALPEALQRLARHFKVSTLVILRRIYDTGSLTKEQFRRAYSAELEKLQTTSKPSSGDFYLTQAARVGKRFARALITSTLEGQTLYLDAFRLLGFSKTATFHELGHSLGVN
jgi:Zn-dependent peptidase ImmA (M78 family)